MSHETDTRATHFLLQRCSAFYSWCIQNRYAKENITKFVILPPRPRKGPPEFLKLWQVKRILQKTHEMYPELVPAMALQLFTGIRTEEMTKVDWAKIKLGEYIDLDHTKTGVRRVLEFFPSNLVEWLKPYVRPAGRVVPGLFKNKRWWVFKAATHDDVTGERLFTFPQNGCRHSFATYAWAYLDSPHKVMLMMGHRNLDMLHQHYRNYVSKAEAAEYFSLTPASVLNQPPTVAAPNGA